MKNFSLSFEIEMALNDRECARERARRFNAKLSEEGEIFLQKIRARRKARKLGLAYWPALLSNAWGQVSPEAFLRAEEVLAPIHGRYGDRLPSGERSRGGWDSMGHYGLDPQFVRDAWWAAGCKPGAKFNAQIRARVLARKSESLRDFLRFVRGARWLDANFRRVVALTGPLSRPD